MRATRINIDTKTFVRFWLVVAGFAVGLFLVWKLWTALLLILISFFLALALNPAVSTISRRLPGKSRLFATLIAYLVILTVLGGFIYVAVPPTIEQTGRFVAALPGYIDNLTRGQGLVADFINRYELHDELERLVSGLQDQFTAAAGGVGSSVVSGVTSFFGGLVAFITVLVLTFVMLVEAPMWMERLWHAYTDKAKLERHRRVATKMYKVVSSYVNGQVLVALIASLASLTVLVILSNIFGLPGSILLPLAGVVFITSLIPMVGATIGATIATIVLLFNDFGAALIYLIYFIIYQQIENNFIQPLVQSRTVALSALTVLVAVIIGISLLGIIGGIIAIPIAGCLRVAFLDYMEHRHKSAGTARLATRT